MKITGIKKNITFLILLQFFVIILFSQNPILICGEKNNDLITTLENNKIPVQVFSTIDELLSKAKDGNIIMILAQNYPKELTQVDEKIYETIKIEKLHAFIEFPSYIPKIEIGKIKETMWDRGVVMTDTYGADLPKMKIFSVNNCHVTPVKIDNPLLVLAKVAGFDIAVYGLDSVEVNPILFKLPDNENVLISTTKFSNFITGRYGPKKAWAAIWNNILNGLYGKKTVKELKWEAAVHPTFNAVTKLPDDAKENAIIKGVSWIFKGHLLVHPDWKDSWWLKYQGDGSYPFGIELDQNLPDGDGSLGILQGQASKIYWNGKQQYNYWMRADCCGESAMTFSFGSYFTNSDKNKLIAKNLLNYLYKTSNLRQGIRNDPKSSSFGLIGWATTHPYIYYGDDNARVFLGSIATSSILGDGSWDDYIIQGILGNLRTSSYTGCRKILMDDSAFIKNNRGWQTYFERKLEIAHPHLEAWILTTYLWLYDKTKYKPLLRMTENAIKIHMKNYPDNWSWLNGLQQERARMVLPLAWLVRAEDTPEHREWLKKIVTDLVKFQKECGGIEEQLGDEKKGWFGATKSNPAYGTSEAPLIQKNGDPVVDMLYTTNFAAIGMNEAYYATKDSIYGEALGKIIDFLVRIQCKSELNTSLDGAWFRAFDYKDWDYWASNADLGWGAWGTLTGWTQSWIITSIALQHMKTSLWDIAKNTRVNDKFKANLELMMPAKELEKIYIKKLTKSSNDSIESIEYYNNLSGDERFDNWYKANKEIAENTKSIKLTSNDENVFYRVSKEGKIFYIIYAGNDKEIKLKNIPCKKKGKIKVLGYDKTLTFAKDKEELIITIPDEIKLNSVIVLKID